MTETVMRKHLIHMKRIIENNLVEENLYDETEMNLISKQVISQFIQRFDV